MSQTMHRGVYDKDGVGLVLVALVAPGAMWREKSRLLDGIVQEPGPSYILFKGLLRLPLKGSFKGLGCFGGVPGRPDFFLKFIQG